jgi:hypothetical protein
MARPQQSSTFVVPAPTSGVTAASGGPKQKRDPKSFVIVPDSMGIADDKLEPHWLPAIDAATD